MSILQLLILLLFFFFITLWTILVFYLPFMGAIWLFSCIEWSTAQVIYQGYTHYNLNENNRKKGFTVCETKATTSLTSLLFPFYRANSAACNQNVCSQSQIVKYHRSHWVTAQMKRHAYLRGLEMLKWLSAEFLWIYLVQHFWLWLFL